MDPNDSTPPPEGATNIVEFTVSQLSFALKKVVEGQFSHVRVRGELGRISRPGSGHIYLDLKDENAVLAGIVWRGQALKLKIQPEQGLEVIVTGRLTTYPGQSRYQIVIEAMEPAGVGALMALLEERKKKLSREGLFDEALKKPLPFLPKVIGLITSPTGAVIRDMMHGFLERFPTHVIVWPVRVQGESSAAEVTAAILGFNELRGKAVCPRPDLLIVARGGGSLEDLWGFNDETLVRAVHASAIPVISAIGHETDWTLIDLVADSRAPTPTKAAEWAVPKYSELLKKLADNEERSRRAIHRLFEALRSGYQASARGMPRLSDLIALPRQRFDALSGRLGRSLTANNQIHKTSFMAQASRLHPKLLDQPMVRRRERLHTFAARVARAHIGGVKVKRALWEKQAKLLQALSYRNVLRRGYVILRNDQGQMVRAAKSLSLQQNLEIELTDGTAHVRTTKIMTKTEAGKKDVQSRAKKPPSRRQGKQGTLF